MWRRIMDKKENKNECMQQELEDEFNEKAGYLFDWRDTHTLIKEGEPVVWAEGLSLEMIVNYIRDGYSPIPF